MGAKTPEQVNKTANKPRPTVKCDVCGRKFLNIAALKSHQKFLHLKGESTKRVAFKRQEDAKPAKKLIPVHMLKRVSRSSADKQAVKTAEPEESPDLAGKPASVSKKPEFECPACALKYPVYFTAFRHIQKNHCVNDKGENVPPNSPHLIKPIRIETCASCSQQIRSTEPHNCPKRNNRKDQYFCLGCEQIFSGLVLFQNHIKGLHEDGAQNFFFPSREEFASWKLELQEHIKNEFVRLNRHKSKEVYHCSYQAPGVQAPSATKLCPSTITVKEYTKGIHVCYHREHHGHSIDSIPFKKYNKYSISLYTRDTEELKLDDDEDNNDLYTQFKKMVTCIVFDAAKVDVPTLKELLGKALEMTAVLKHYDGEEREPPLISKCLSDDQISKTLDSLKTNQGKRKHSPEPKAAKRIVPKRIKKGSTSVEKLVENGVTTRLSKSSPALNKSSPVANKSTPASNKSVTFTKSILKKNSEPLTEIEDTQKKILETPQKSLPKKTDEKKKHEETEKPVSKKAEEPEVLKPEEPVPVPPRSLLQSPSSFNDSYKNFVDQNFKCQTEMETSTPKPKPIVKKKEVVKTKMGQFKVKTSVSPKIMSPKSPKEVRTVKEVKVPVTPKNWKAKLDIQYEVKERENDCNILILKI